MWYMFALAAYGFYAFKTGWSDFLAALLVVGVGLALDYALHRLQKTGRDKFPKSGLITALIVLVLLPAGIKFLPALSALVFAVISKHFILFRRRHVFNPAAFGAALSALVFGFSLGWRVDGFAWLVILLGLAACFRVKKYWQVGAFLLVYASYLAFQGGFVDISGYSVYLVPWFFALFILPEPMTSPAGKKKEAAFGAVTAGLVIGFSQIPPAAELALPLALLAGNALWFLWKWF